MRQHKWVDSPFLFAMGDYFAAFDQGQPKSTVLALHARACRLYAEMPFWYRVKWRLKLWRWFAPVRLKVWFRKHIIAEVDRAA